VDNTFGICRLDHSRYDFAQENGIIFTHPRFANISRVHECIVECTSPSKKPILPQSIAKDDTLIGYTTKLEWAEPDGKRYTSRKLSSLPFGWRFKHKRRCFTVPSERLIELTTGSTLDDDHAILTCLIRPRYPSIVACCPLAGWPSNIPSELKCLTLLSGGVR